MAEMDRQGSKFPHTDDASDVRTQHAPDTSHVASVLDPSFRWIREHEGMHCHCCRSVLMPFYHKCRLLHRSLPETYPESECYS